jgi:uncharacterized membrane protein YqjE
MKRLLNAFTALLFGCGILVLVVGLFSDQYKWQYGLIGMVALWVIAFALRVFLSTRGDD